ncbi:MULTISPECIES: hypothetical protein [Microbacterium]|uniref:hypothetical protein n=1 Tax=Microbacterium TaxID=33882 RepID=UPI000D01F1CA|nr:hypothetical protein [Microbacterium sp. str. 'China']AVL96943.1 hypothetical protein C6C15_07410 [Microbacterium sp. str. 'China']
MRLSRDTLLSIHLDAICSRNRYTKDPAPVIDELRATAGDRTDLLAQSVGTWVGFFEDDYTRILCTALRELADLEPWIALGQHRRSLPDPSTPERLGHGQAAALPLYITTDSAVLDAP